MLLSFGADCGMLGRMKRPESSLKAPLVVGTIHSPGALRCALKLKRGQVDVLELRVDAFEESPDLLWRAVPRLAAPLLLTVRHPAEGGAAVYGPARRRELYRQYLPSVAWVDFEVRSMRAMAEEIALASALGVRVVISDHHFRGTPSLEVLKKRFARAQACRPELVKVAASARTPAELERLLAFLNWSERRQAGRLSVMGMGRCGQVSRLLLGSCGSVLNYGYLDTPQVSGQWPAVLLKQRLAELAGGTGD